MRAALVLVCGHALAGGCSAYDKGLLPEDTRDNAITDDAGTSGAPANDAATGVAGGSGASGASGDGGAAADDAGFDAGPAFDPLSCAHGECWWSDEAPDTCKSAGVPTAEDRPNSEGDGTDVEPDIYLGWTRIRLGSSLPDGTASNDAWTGFGLDLDGICTNSTTCPELEGQIACRSLAPQIPFDGELCRDNIFASLQPIAAQVPEIGDTFGISEVGSSRVDLQACKLEYSIVSPK